MKAILIAASVVVALSTPALAEHNSLAAGPGATAPEAATAPDADRASSDVDIQLKVGRDYFRLGTRRSGANGVAGAWLNGEVTARGFAVDGRVQDETGRSHTFKLDADLADLLAPSLIRWMLGQPVSRDD